MESSHESSDRPPQSEYFKTQDGTVLSPEEFESLRTSVKVKRTATDSKFKVPKVVPPWVFPFLEFCNNPQVFTLWEQHWGRFFAKNFHAPKPRNPVNPMKTLAKTAKAVEGKIKAGDLTEQDIEALNETRKALNKSFDDLAKDGKVAADSPTPSRKRRRRAQSKKANVCQEFDAAKTLLKEEFIDGLKKNDPAAMKTCFDKLEQISTEAITVIANEDEVTPSPAVGMDTDRVSMSP